MPRSIWRGEPPRRANAGRPAKTAASATSSATANAISACANLRSALSERGTPARRTEARRRCPRAYRAEERTRASVFPFRSFRRRDAETSQPRWRTPEPKTVVPPSSVAALASAPPRESSAADPPRTAADASGVSARVSRGGATPRVRQPVFAVGSVQVALDAREQRRAPSGEARRRGRARRRRARARAPAPTPPKHAPKNEPPSSFRTRTLSFPLSIPSFPSNIRASSQKSSRDHPPAGSLKTHWEERRASRAAEVSARQRGRRRPRRPDRTPLHVAADTTRRRDVAGRPAVARQRRLCAVRNGGATSPRSSTSRDSVKDAPGAHEEVLAVLARQRDVLHQTRDVVERAVHVLGEVRPGRRRQRKR